MVFFRSHVVLLMLREDNTKGKTSFTPGEKKVVEGVILHHLRSANMQRTLQPIRNVSKRGLLYEHNSALIPIEPPTNLNVNQLKFRCAGRAGGPLHHTFEPPTVTKNCSLINGNMKTSQKKIFFAQRMNII